MEEYITAYEYEKNVNPTLNNVPIVQKNINDCEYGITTIEFSESFNVDYKATTPNLLASFIKLKQNYNFTLDEKNTGNFVNGTSHLFYIISGNCEMNIDNEVFRVSEGDILITPLFESLLIKNNSDEELQIYYINLL